MNAQPRETTGPADQADPPQHASHSARYTFGTSRFLIVLAIAGTIASALSMLVFALLVGGRTVWDAFAAGDFTVDEAKHLAVELIEMTDLFLLGMVLYVVAIGMYQLFINPKVAVPSWMRVDGLADLKTQLLNVIVVLLAVTFLATAVSWTSGNGILYDGLAIGAMILALAGYNLAQHVTHSDDDGQ
jgi:uncharacterized membrane protein YqhA